MLYSAEKGNYVATIGILTFCHALIMMIYYDTDGCMLCIPKCKQLHDPLLRVCERRGGMASDHLLFG